MTAEEYFAISIPTNKDFKKWTKSFFVRVDKAIKNAERYLGETTSRKTNDKRKEKNNGK